MSERIEPKVLEGEINIPYTWTAGKIIGRFLASLMNKKVILGGKCKKCGKVWVPPYDQCSTCFMDFDIDDLIAVKDEGIVTTYTIVEYPLIWRPLGPPYGIIAVKLDGADTDLIHLVKDDDLKKLKAGVRVKAVWKDKRNGEILDIERFKVI